MELKRFIDDDDAVSPVIGVILMVAITVILAAVIATFVLGLGDQVSNTAPQASFTFEYEGGSAQELRIVHDGGDTIEAGELYLRGSNLGSGNTGVWYNLDNTAASGSTSEVAAGDSALLGASGGTDVPTDYNARVVYEATEGDSSATLAKDEGPDA